MTRVPSLIFLTVLISITLFPMVAGGMEQQYDWSAGAAAKNVSIANIAGDITIKTGGDRVVIKAVKRLAAGETADKADFDRIEVIFEEKGEAASARVEYPEERGKDWPDVEVVFDVTMPAGGKAAATSISGRINAAGELAAFTANAVSGDVTLNAGTRGTESVTVKTVSGDVAAAWAPTTEGEYDLTSVSGTLAAELAGDLPALNYDITTLSGHYQNKLATAGDASRGTAALAFTTVSGDINVGPPTKAAAK